jgi:hypothetical protein
MSNQDLHCKKCGQNKPITSFYKDKYSKRGYKNYCKECLKSQPKIVDEKNIKKNYEEVVETSKKINNLETILSELDFMDSNFILKNCVEIKDAFKKIKNPAICIFGSRRSGKTTLIKKILPFVCDKCNLIIFFCGSLSNEIYDDLKKSEIGNKCAFIENFNDSFVKDIFTLQKTFKNKLSVGIVFDDESDLSTVKNSKHTLKIYNKGRNHNITIIDAKHGGAFLNKNNRGNIDIALFMKLNTPELKYFSIKSFMVYNLKEIDKKYFLKRSDYEDLCFKIYSKNTENPGDCICMDFVNENNLYLLK